MKKFSFLVMISLLGTVFAAAPALAQEDEGKCYQEWYDAAQTKKDLPLAAKLGKSCLEKFPQSQNAKYWQNSITKYLNSLRGKFYEGVQAYYAGPEAAKLNTLVEEGEKYLAEKQAFTGQSSDGGVTIYTALTTSFGGMNGHFDLDKARGYAEKALPLLESASAPEGLTAEQYAGVRDSALARLNQLLGYYQLKQATPNYEQAEGFLSKSAAIKSKQPGEGWKDPNNYNLRTQVYNSQYQTLSSQYRALPPEKQSGDEGKALLDKLNPVVDKLIMDYARVVALSSDPRLKALQDDAKERLEAFWKFKYNKTDGMAEYIRGYEADPTVSQALPPVPETPAPQAPAGKPASGRP
ncbi:MAG TPA: hypothetical protein VNQ79_06205 [Blastocatellia bacterium]|nr:hypothetical protein [Blastocatellia bacterium]